MTLVNRVLLSAVCFIACFSFIFVNPIHAAAAKAPAHENAYVDPYENPSAAEGDHLEATGIIEEDSLPTDDPAIVMVSTNDGHRFVLVLPEGDISYQAGQEITVHGEIAGVMVTQDDGKQVPIVDAAEITMVRETKASKAGRPL